MNIQITNMNWVNLHQDEIKNWSSMEILSIAHREFLCNAQGGLATYQSIKKLFVSKNTNSNTSIDVILRHREKLSECVNEINREYVKLSHQIYDDELEELNISSAGLKLVLKFYNNANLISSEIFRVKKQTSIDGCNLLYDDQNQLLLLASQYDKNLLSIVYCLSIWMSANGNRE